MTSSRLLAVAFFASLFGAGCPQVVSSDLQLLQFTMNENPRPNFYVLVEVAKPIFWVTTPGARTAREITSAGINTALTAKIGDLATATDALLDNASFPAAVVSGVGVQKLQSPNTQLEEWTAVLGVTGMTWADMQHKYALMKSIDDMVLAEGSVYASGIINVAANYGHGELQTVRFQETLGSSSDRRASSKGDPHLVNIHGQKFDLMQPGVHVLLLVPRRAKPRDTLLRVEADAQRMGTACADLYFEALNITGSWSGQAEGLQFFAKTQSDRMDSKNKTESLMDWKRFGTVDLKVIRGHTADGIVYLNVFVKHLNAVGYPVGGLLGEDDHKAAATPGTDCSLSVDLHTQDSPTASVAMIEG